jgi:hypothetical protein
MMRRDKIMKKRQYWVMLVFATIAGFMGGTFANSISPIQSAFGEKKNKPAKVVEAEQIRIVDKDGTLQIMLGNGSTEGGPYLIMYGEDDSGIRLELAHGKPALILTYKAGLGRVVLGMPNRTPSMSFRYGSKGHLWSIPEERGGR